MHLSKGVSLWFWLKIFQLFILGKENEFDDNLNGFLDDKNIDFKKRKKCFFSKGLVHGFGQKFGNFPPFHF